MKLYKTDEYEGYWLKDLLSYCKKRSLAERFDFFMSGKTGGMYEDTYRGKKVMKLIVFKWDWEKFLRNVQYPN